MPTVFLVIKLGQSLLLLPGTSSHLARHFCTVATALGSCLSVDGYERCTPHSNVKQGGRHPSVYQSSDLAGLWLAHIPLGTLSQPNPITQVGVED